MSHRRGIWKRWRDIIALGAVGAGVSLLLAPYLDFLAQAIQKTTLVRLISAGLGVVLLAIPLLWQVGQGRWWACLGIRHLGRFPPTWVAAVIGLAIFVFTCRWFGCPITGIDNALFRFWLLVGLLSLLLVGFAASLVQNTVRLKYLRRTRQQREHDAKPRKKITDLIQLDKMVAWFSTDHEVARPEDDWFEHDAVAQRIVRRLSGKISDEEAPTIAVVGPLGSGKSTIAKLVEHHASTNQNIEIVRVSLWAFDSPDAAVRGILSALLGGLAQHVNIWALAGIPEQYTSTIERVGGRWGSFARVLTRPLQPAEVLERLENITRATGVRVVLWIEDLERFASLGPDSAQHNSDADSRLGPIRALLYLLDRCERLSVVVADCSLDARFDLDKIARFVERVPKLEPEKVRQMFRAYRDNCIERMIPKIDPVPDKDRDEFLKVHNPTVRAWLRHDPGRLDAETALSNLLTTPRSLKTALRSAHEVWGKLAGEIDLDDVLIMSAIRAARPNIFSFIDRYIEVFRQGFRVAIPLQDNKPEDHPVYKEFTLLLQGEASDGLRASVQFLVRLVFRTLPGGNSTVDGDLLYINHPQGLSATRDKGDYWLRYLSTPDISEDESDQAALRSIKQWKLKEANGLIERLCDSEKSDRIEHFVGSFDADELPRLLSDVVLEQKETSARTWGENSDAPGVISVWRMMQHRTPPCDSLLSTLLELIDLVGPLHLPLIHTLRYYLGSPPDSSIVPLLHDQQQYQAVADAVKRVLLDYCDRDGAEKLIVSLREGSPELLLRLSRRIFPLQESDNSDRSVEDWAKFAKTMLDAAEHDPERGIAQVVPFVVHVWYEDAIVDDRRIHRQKIRFERTTAERLFDFDRLNRILAQSEIPEGLPEVFQQMWKTAKEACSNADTTELTG